MLMQRSAGNRIVILGSRCRPTGLMAMRFARLLERRTRVKPEEFALAFELIERLPTPCDQVGRKVLVIGSRMRRAVGLPPCLIHPVVLNGVTYRQLPQHSHWYRDPVCAELAALVLEEMYDEWSRGK